MGIPFTYADAAEVKIKPVTIDLHNQARLQRGARLYMNYCSGCHSLRYIRYHRMAEDLGLTTFDGHVDKDLLTNNLIFTTAKIYDPIEISMPEADARQWFGKMPPDLSLSGRERGANWLYTYLKSFYVDHTRPFGANNLLIPDVAMPNVLAPLQGEVVAEKTEKQMGKPQDATLVLIKNGEMTQQQFDSALQDLVTFLMYVAEPNQFIRYRIGWFVMIFLGLFAVVAFQLKKLYWRNIH
nr:cytochrome c1 [Legionella nagasakiensis]